MQSATAPTSSSSEWKTFGFCCGNQRNGSLIKNKLIKSWREESFWFKRQGEMEFYEKGFDCWESSALKLIVSRRRKVSIVACTTRFQIEMLEFEFQLKKLQQKLKGKLSSVHPNHCKTYSISNKTASIVQCVIASRTISYARQSSLNNFIVDSVILNLILNII